MSVAKSTPSFCGTSLSSLIDVSQWSKNTCSQFDGNLSVCTQYRVGKTRCRKNLETVGTCRRLVRKKEQELCGGQSRAPSQASRLKPPQAIKAKASAPPLTRANVLACLMPAGPVRRACIAAQRERQETIASRTRRDETAKTPISELPVVDSWHVCQPALRLSPLSSNSSAAAQTLASHNDSSSSSSSDRSSINPEIVALVDVGRNVKNTCSQFNGDPLACVKHRVGRTRCLVEDGNLCRRDMERRACSQVGEKALNHMLRTPPLCALLY